MDSPGGGVSPKNYLFEQLAPKMSKCWNQVALKLGFKEEDIRRLRLKHDNRTDRAVAMLLEWRQDIPFNAKKELVRVLNDVNKEYLAREVEKSDINFFRLT